MHTVNRKIKLFLNLSSKEDNDLEEYIQLDVKNNMIIINIKKDISVNDEAFNKILKSNNIPFEVFITYNSSIIKQQTIYIIKQNNKQWFLATTNYYDPNYPTYIINEYKNNQSLSIKLWPYKFHLSTKDKSFIKYRNTYESHGITNEEIFKLINNIKNIILEFKKQEVYIERIYFDLTETFEVVNDMVYKPIISDGTITLYTYKDADVAIDNDCNFIIVLNDCLKPIGEIGFRYQSSFTYEGNTSYHINEKYQGKHYASKALALLKKVAEAHKNNGNKCLYVSTKKENIKSQKVALNNNGKLCYSGPVNKNDSLYYIDGVDNVKIYKIDIPKMHH